MAEYEICSQDSPGEVESVGITIDQSTSGTTGRNIQRDDALSQSPLQEENQMTIEDSSTASQVVTEKSGDPYSAVKHLLVPTGLGTSLPTQRVRTHIKVERPAPTSWFRVYPVWGPWDDAFRIFIYECQGDIPSQLVEPHVVSEDLGLKIKRPTLYVDRSGELRLWLIAGGSYSGAAPRAAPSSWETTAIQAAEIARTAWVRISSNKSAGIYDIHRVREGVVVPEPDWSGFGDLDPVTILGLAFGADRRIASVDHPILKTLRGEF